MTTDFKEKLNRAPLSGLKVYEITPDRVQVMSPYKHADGDPIEIYLVPSDQGEEFVRITDCGMTLMRLSYSEDITDSVRDRLQELSNQDGIKFNDGVIYADVLLASLKPSISDFAMTVRRIMNLQN